MKMLEDSSKQWILPESCQCTIFVNSSNCHTSSSVSLGIIHQNDHRKPVGRTRLERTLQLFADFVNSKNVSFILIKTKSRKNYMINFYLSLHKQYCKTSEKQEMMSSTHQIFCSVTHQIFSLFCMYHVLDYEVFGLGREIPVGATTQEECTSASPLWNWLV